MRKGAQIGIWREALPAIGKTLLFIPKQWETEAFEGGRSTVGFMMLEVYSARDIKNGREWIKEDSGKPGKRLWQ